MKEYYSEYITNEFIEKLDDIKKNKGLKETGKRHILGYTFIFISQRNGKFICNSFKEEDLNTKVENPILYITVLLRTESLYNEYWNLDYFSLGIFNKNGNPATIKYENLEIEYFCTTSTVGHYNMDLLDSINIILINHPFEKYLNTVLRPVRKALKTTLPKSVSLDRFDIQSGEMPISITIDLWYGRYVLPNDFDEFLNEVKEFDEKLGNIRRFKPEDYQ